ncbi:hypothetical protein [Streptomyces caatingaensis]|uniref:Uncharacterized protein n=1 Tax=Streptomyces caatingaensis TaxID=1678637 RepID=A0A0K9XDP4_9ACTN|nr:hypothetical protein AC230_19945 [Streptomyces caatingaensis]
MSTDHPRPAPGARSTAADVLAGTDLTGRTALVTGGASGIGLPGTEAVGLDLGDQDCAVARPAATDDMLVGGVKPWATDPAAAARLWELSAGLTGLDAFTP